MSLMVLKWCPSKLEPIQKFSAPKGMPCTRTKSSTTGSPLERLKKVKNESLAVRKNGKMFQKIRRTEQPPREISQTISGARIPHITATNLPQLPYAIRHATKVQR